MKILSICVGKPREIEWQGKTVSTGIWKYPIQGPVKVRRTNIEGDGQADLKVHGGIDKAVYAYSYDTYDNWKRVIQKELPHYTEELFPGAFGENLVMDQLDEKNIFLGDVFQVGEVQLEVSEPRFPCFKLGIKFGTPKIIKLFLDSERSGVYFRVLKEGTIKAGDSFKLLSQENTKVSIHEIVLFYINKQTSPQRAREILQVKRLGAKWREKFEKVAIASS